MYSFMLFIFYYYAIPHITFYTTLYYSEFIIIFHYTNVLDFKLYKKKRFCYSKKIYVFKKKNTVTFK
jgi:hypothetical protein